MTNHAAQDDAVRETFITGAIIAVPGIAGLILCTIMSATGSKSESDPASWTPIGWGILAIIYIIVVALGTITVAAITANSKNTLR